MVGISTLVFIPSIFYWINYRTTNLIAATGYTSFDFITVNKILSLFFEPNFGIFTFIPLFLFVIIYLILKLDIIIILSLFLLLIISVICSSQLNWNSGMMYINRYSVWLIPIMLFSFIHFIQKLQFKRFIIFICCFILTTGIITTKNMFNYDMANYLKFNSIATMMLSNYPVLYNPVPEVFAERALNTEVNFEEQLPIVLSSEKGDRKTLLKNTNGDFQYVNGDNDFSFDHSLYLMSKYTGGTDIFLQDTRLNFFKGVYGLESNELGNFRWLDKESEILFQNDFDGNVSSLKFYIGSFNEESNLKVILNDEEIYHTLITPKITLLEINVNLKEGKNKLKLVSDKVFIPMEVGSNSADSRTLSYMISNFEFKITE